MKDIEQQAQSEGWRLDWIVDNGTTHPYLSIFGVRMSDLQARDHVLTQAKAFSGLHMRALQAVMRSRLPPTPTPTGKRK